VNTGPTFEAVDQQRPGEVLLAHHVLDWRYVLVAPHKRDTAALRQILGLQDQDGLAAWVRSAEMVQATGIGGEHKSPREKTVLVWKHALKATKVAREQILAAQLGNTGEMVHHLVPLQFHATIVWHQCVSPPQHPVRSLFLSKRLAKKNKNQKGANQLPPSSGTSSNPSRRPTRRTTAYLWQNQ
jgi:hypothetical protein